MLHYAIVFSPHFIHRKLVTQTLYSIPQHCGHSSLKDCMNLQPVQCSSAKRLYHSPKLEQITAVEKDRLTGLVLSAINSTLPVKTATHITGFEEAPVKDANGTYDLVVSNIPFWNFSIYDEPFPIKRYRVKYTIIFRQRSGQTG